MVGKKWIDSIRKNSLYQQQGAYALYLLYEWENTGKLNDLEHQVCDDILIRCHQSFIVNIYHVEGLNGTNLIVAGEEIPVSRRYYDKVRKRYREILFEEVE